MILVFIVKIGFKCYYPPSAPVAQLDRASDFESAGRAFESPRVRHLSQVKSIN